MKRLLRISITLFASALILLFLVLKRLERAREAALQGLPWRDEEQMAWIGIGLSGIMLLASIGLLARFAMASRKQRTSLNG